MRKWLVILALLLLPGWAAHAQGDSLRLGHVVRGQVTDRQSGAPLEAVQVRLPGWNYATVTNADGIFVLKADVPIAQIECTHLGYKPRKVSVGGQPFVRVGMERESIPLNEAVLVSGNARAIVEAAVRRLPDTYGPTPQLLECFYRETLRKKNRYTYVAEAVARLYKSAWDGTVTHDAAALEKSRILVSQRKRDTLSVKMQGGPTQAVALDAAKNLEVLLEPRDLDDYAFEMDFPAYVNDRVQFVIRFHPARQRDYALYEGTLYIDREHLSFTRIEMAMDMRDQARATRALLVRKPLSLRFFPEEASFVLNYTLDGGRSRLAYYRGTLRFLCDWRKRLFRTRYVLVNELVVTDILPESAPIPRAHRFRTQDILGDKAAEFQDPDFWRDYNIIEPSESLEHAMDRLRKGR